MAAMRLLLRLLVLVALLAAVARWAAVPLGRARAAVQEVEARALMWTTRGMDGLTRGALLAFARAGSGAAAPRALSSRGAPARTPRAEAWVAVGPGVRFRRVVLADGMRLNQVEADPRKAALKVLYARDQGRRNATVADLASAAGACAAINASYFGTDDEPLGYLKANGRVIVGSIATGAAFTGVFVLDGGVPSIVPRASFDAAAADTALQAGPRLVAGGAMTQGLRETRSFRQTGIAVTRSGRVVLYATDGSYTGLTWQETRRILMGPAAQGGIQPTDVLNLDGGSSSQMYVALPGAPDVRTGFPTRVPVALGILSGRR